MNFKSILAVLLVIITANTASANKKILIGDIDGLDPTDTSQSYHVLLALSGGGARGLTTIGILKAFEEKGIKPVGIAGTSMGGIIGGLYASGYDSEELDSIAEKLDISALFTNNPPRKSMFLTKRLGRENHLISVRFDKYRPVIPKALTSGQELTALLTELTTRPNYQCDADFSRLPIPYLTLSTDIVSGNQVLLKNGSIADAMRATMAFPLAFTGLERGEQILMDGGIVTPIPVDLVRTLSHSVDFVVAINTASTLLKKDEIVTPVDIADQVTTIMAADKLKQQLDRADFVIKPNIDGFVSSDFKYKDSLVQIGYQDGLIAANKIIEMIDVSSSRQEILIVGVESRDIPEPELQGLKNQVMGTKMTEQQLIRRMTSFVNEQDYFSLEVEIFDDTTDRDNERKFLSLSGFKNFATDVYIEFHGNEVFTTSELADQLIRGATEISSAVIKRGLQNVIDLYTEQGYNLVNIKKVEINPAIPKISITVDEARITSIDVEQNKLTKDWFIRSYFPLQTKEPYSTEKASEGIRNIYGTALFDRVSVDALPSDEGVVVKIGVTEKQSSQLRLGWHWHEEYESEEFVEFLNDNFAGIGLEYLLHARYSPNRQNYFFSFKADRILASYITSQFKLYRTILNRQTYNDDDKAVGIREERKTGFSMKVGQQIARLGTVSADFTVEEIDYYDTQFEEKVHYGLRSLRLESLIENFDRLPFPTSGNKHLFQLQFAGKFFGGDLEYTKFYTSHEAYISLNSTVTLHPLLALGASRSGLPPTEQFYLGGQHLFIGFRTHQLAGDKMFLFSNEIRFKLPLNLYLSAIYDLGEVYNSSDQIKVRNLRNAVGAAITLDSPLGPLEFGYGIVNQDQEQTYLNLGFQF